MSLNNIPTITIESVKNEKGEIQYKKIIYPNNQVHMSTNINHLEDGKYFGIFELCQTIDRNIMPKENEKVVIDIETGKEYQTTEEIQHFLETEVLNPYFSRKTLPKEYGYYIHESAQEALLGRLEKLSTQKIAQQVERRALQAKKKIKEAQKEYMSKDSPSNILNKLTKKEIGITITAVAGALILASGVVQVIANSTKEEKKVEVPPQPEYNVEFQEYENNLSENPDITEIKLEELYQNIVLGANYNIDSTKLYEASDHSGKYGTISGNYSISMVAVIDENDKIHQVSLENNENKTISEVVPESVLENAKIVSTAISTPDGTIIGWIDVDKTAFKELAEKIANEKSPILTGTYSVTTNDPDQIIHPETGERLNIVYGNVYDQMGNLEENIQVTSITDENGNIINLDNNATRKGR